MATLVELVKQLIDLQQINSLNTVIKNIARQQQFIEDIIRSNRLLADFYTDNIRQKLAQRGWFIAGSLNPGHYQHLAKALKNREDYQVEEFLKIHVRGLVFGIKLSAVKRWKKRAKILTDAFDAHSSGEYTLSVPVFLAQADGISADQFGAYLFTTRKGSIKKAVSRIIENHSEMRPLAKSFLSFLLESSGLQIKKSKRDIVTTTGFIFSPLNRHNVLHGLDCDYATEANSLRGIALISFLEWISQLFPIKKEPTTSVFT